MFAIQSIFWIIYMLGITSSLSLKQCDDCISLDECNTAFNLLTAQNSITKIQKSVCKIYKRGKAIQKVDVCCSDFDDLENHKNRILLPDIETCGQIRGNKLIGGSTAALNEFPWMVMILNGEKSPVCGASLINNRYILTAAHCVTGWNPTTVRLGEYDFSKRIDCDPIIKTYCIRHKNLRISDVIAHPLYARSPRMVNDIALVRLATPANFSYENIQPICLPLPQNLINKELEGNLATIAGWGQTENSGLSHVLRKAEIFILNKTTCDSYYVSSSANNKFCAGTDGKDTCKGDSGGPLMILDEYYNRYNFVQYGIVSYGFIECNGALPGVYVDIRPYLKWILDSIKE